MQNTLGPAAIPRPVKAAFLSCFAAGYLAHLFAFTNLIPNSDGLSRVFDTQQMTVAGRWFLHYASFFHGFLQAPAVIGFFTVLFLSLAAGFTVSLLRIEGSVQAGLAGVLMAVFPSVAFTLLYLFTSSAYSFGILLAVLSVWLTDRKPRLLIPGALVLACAVGTYQAYFGVAAALALIRVLCFAMDPDRSAKQTLRFGLRFLALLLAGLALYYVELLVFLRVKHLTLMDYKDIGELGSGSLLGTMLSRLGAAYTDFSTLCPTPLLAAASLAFLGTGVWALVRIGLRSGQLRRPAFWLRVLPLLALLPLALNVPVLLVKHPRDYMRYSLVFGCVLVLALTDRACHSPQPAPCPAEQDAPRPAEPRGTKRLSRAAVCLGLLLSILFFQRDNLAYTAAATAHRATLSFATRLVFRVEALPGYESGMEVVIIGSYPDELYTGEVAAFAEVDAPSYSVLTLNKHVYYYLNDWLNVPWQEPPEETFLEVSGSETFRAMPLYPSDGSVVIEDGRVIVKLSPYYRPKSEYEIQYENRK